MSLFDLRPKTSRDELFDREMELEELHRSVEREFKLLFSMLQIP
jgi:AAA+ ATPase superfamily predicted ATPase